MDLADIIPLLFQGDGRLILAGFLFLLMWAIKSLPGMEQKVLTTPRRRLVATAFLAATPAVTMIVQGVAAGNVDWSRVASTAAILFLGAIGIHTVNNVSQGKPVGVQETTDPPSVTFASASGDKIRVGSDGLHIETKKPIAEMAKEVADKENADKENG
jgi:hypothetical protein